MSDNIDTTAKSSFDGMLKDVAEIAQHMHEPDRRVHYMLEKGDLPAFKLRGRWYMRPSALREKVRQLEAEAAAK